MDPYNKWENIHCQLFFRTQFWFFVAYKIYFRWGSGQLSCLWRNWGLNQTIGLSCLAEIIIFPFFLFLSYHLPYNYVVSSCQALQITGGKMRRRKGKGISRCPFRASSHPAVSGCPSSPPVLQSDRGLCPVVAGVLSHWQHSLVSGKERCEFLRS